MRIGLKVETKNHSREWGFTDKFYGIPTLLTLIVLGYVVAVLIHGVGLLFGATLISIWGPFWLHALIMALIVFDIWRNSTTTTRVYKKE